MYRPVPSKSERAATVTVVVLIHAALAYAFLNLSGTIRDPRVEEILQTIDISSEPPPPPEEVVEVELQAAPEEEGEASPPNIESQATPIIDPQPRIALPVPTPMPVSPTPNEGSEPTQGAAPVPGPGTGAGGTGTGTGAGGSGSGGGGGGSGIAATRSAVVRGITNRDYPAAIQRSWPRGGAIFVRLRIEPNGRPSQCDVMRGFGDERAGQWTCSLLMERGVFRPARDERGQPVADWLGYVQRDRG